MRCLMLLRHAKAVAGDGTIRDHERALAPRGRKDVPEMGAYMKRHGLVPDYAIVSPAARTRETWDLTAVAIAASVPVVYEGRLYDATAQIILDVIKEKGGAASRLLVIGHNPGLHKLATTLVAAGDIDARERLSEALPTTGLVTIDFPVDDWKKLHPQAGRLGHFVTPQSLHMATD